MEVQDEEIQIGYWFSKQHAILPDSTYRIKMEVARDLDVPFYTVQFAALLLKRAGLKINYPSLLAAAYLVNKSKLKYNYVLKILKSKRVKGKKRFKRALSALKKLLSSSNSLSYLFSPCLGPV